MNNSIDIDMYKDGFDAKKINCIQSPIAASAGYFERNNYFYYCYLYSLYVFCGNDKYDFFDFSNKILSVMGLSLKCIEYGEDYDKALNVIKNKISNNKPVLIFCKYNTLFYNLYYENPNFKLVHGLIVSGYNDENNTFTINESTLLRNVFYNCENSDVFFPLQIPMLSLKEILMKSNMQFSDINFDMDSFKNKIYYVSKEYDISLQTYDIINKSLELIENNICDNWFILDLKKYHLDNNAVLSHTFEAYFSKYVWGLTPIFKLLYLHIKENISLENKLKELEKEIKNSKNSIISKFVKIVMRKEKINDYQMKSMINNWQKSDRLIWNIITELSGINQLKRFEYYPQSINVYYNCQAFEESISDNSTADITGEGTHFLFDNIKTGMKWQKGDYVFVYDHSPAKNDNISCQGQNIIFNNVHEASSITFLECSEYGSYQEKIVVRYSNGTSFEFNADFSDFFKPSIYDEKLFWSGVALDRKKGKTVSHNFRARLFAKRYEVPSGIISSIQMPNRRNIHIFAITFEYKI